MDEVDARRFLSLEDGPGDDSLDIDGPGEYDRTERASVARFDLPGLGEADRDNGRTRPVKSDLLRLRPPIPLASIFPRTLQLT